MAMLSGTPMRITPYVLLVCSFVFVFVFFFAFAVFAGMQITWQRRGLRTRLLRRARACELAAAKTTTGDNNAGDADAAAEMHRAAQALRHLAVELKSEMSSHYVHMLGIPLNSKLLNELVGGLVTVLVVILGAAK